MDLLTERTIQCPYCGEAVDLVIDCSVSDQEYVEDCSVCCRPIQLHMRIDETGDLSIEVRREDE